MTRICTIILICIASLLNAQSLDYDGNSFIYVAPMPGANSDSIKKIVLPNIKSMTGVSAIATQEGIGYSFNWSDKSMIWYKNFPCSANSYVNVFIKDDKIKIQVSDIDFTTADETIPHGALYSEDYPKVFPGNFIVKGATRKEWIKMKALYASRVSSMCKKLITNNAMDF